MMDPRLDDRLHSIDHIKGPKLPEVSCFQEIPHVLYLRGGRGGEVSHIYSDVIAA